MATETMTVTAPAISCAHCQHAIEGAVGALPGVTSVQVEIASKTVHVTYNPAQVSPETITATMDEEGYPVTP
jgi:copper chaperone CopZ